jgi:alcohol dehydrogenase class IV
MADQELQKSLDEAIQAMDQLSQQFEAKVESLKSNGIEESQVKRLAEGARAMRNSSTLYLEWAAFYVKEVAKAERGGDDAELEELLDEGTDFGGMELR